MPLTIQYCSDLHLEMDLNKKWIGKYPLEVAGDILLLGGDIMPFALQEQHNDFLDHVAASYTAAYWIPGNHEYYHGNIAGKSGTLHEAVRDNVFLVNNTTLSIGDTDLICATLWSHISPANEWEINRAMNDFRLIKDGGGRFTVAAYNGLHEDARLYIEHEIRSSTAKQKIVLTHHVPTLMNYPPKYKGDALNEAFATELHDFIAVSGVDCWLYGHTHCNTPDFKIGDTHMLTNQLGYVRHGEHSTFSRNKVLPL
ncbi:MAG: metallophosphoesterase [Bacteroidota bacterium]